MPRALLLILVLLPTSAAADKDGESLWPAAGAIIEAELRHAAPEGGPATSQGGASVELSLSKRVGPYLRADAYGVASLSGVDLLEAHVGAAYPPLRVAARAGLLRHRIGVQNEWHPHDGVLIERPLGLTRTFGAKGGRALGGEVSVRPSPPSWPWAVEILGAVTDAAGAQTAASFFADTPPPALRGPGDVLYLAALKQAVSARGLTLGLGLSAVLGPNATGRDNRTDVFGADLRAELQRPALALVLLSEWFWRRRQVPGALRQDLTGYAETQIQIRLGGAERQLHLGLRYEYAGPVDGPAARHRAALGLLGQFTSWMLLRAQGALDLEGGALGYAVHVALQGRMGRHEDR